MEKIGTVNETWANFENVKTKENKVVGAVVQKSTLNLNY